MLAVLDLVQQRKGLHPMVSHGLNFADPDWRGDQARAGEADDDLRPLASLAAQEVRLQDWIRGGSYYGWLSLYQTRRAAFELQAIRAQRRQGSLGSDCRRAIQSRLDRLDEVLGHARNSAQRPWQG
jgi:hypothetical protein